MGAEMDFTKEDAGHHPVVFFRDTKREMRNCFFGLTLGEKGLCQTKSKELVVGRAFDKCVEVMTARGHFREYRCKR